MGAVYLAWDPVLERRVALKAIRLGETRCAVTTERFRREAMALAQLNHRHVCQVHDWVEDRGSAYIAMEYIEGDTLLKVAPGMDLRQKLVTLHAIALALEAAHAKGIVHRDLKPGNVMVDAAGQVKVLDFGLARLVDAAHLQGETDTGSEPRLPNLEGGSGEGATQAIYPASVPGERTSHGSSQPASSRSGWGEMTEAGSFVGSPTYASPEQMRGRQVGPKSDVFSLGVVAWELILGDHPFLGEGRDRMAATIEGELQTLRGRRLSRPLKTLLRAMLHTKASARPASSQVAEALSRLLVRRPAVWWAAAAGFLLLLGLGYALFGRSIIADLGTDRPPRVAVMPVRNATGEVGLDAVVAVGMTELLANALHTSPSLTVVEPESVTRAITSLRLSPAESLEPASQLRIANALGARLLVRGTLSRDPAAHALVLTYALVDQTGRARFSGSSSAAQQAAFAPLALVDPAVHDLLRKVDPLRSGKLGNPPVPPETFATYANGKALFLKGDFKGSEPFLREAALKAPGFSSAVSAYAACLRRLGRDQALAVANWALMSARATGDRWAEGRALGLKAYLAKDQGDLDEAQRLRAVELALAQAIGDRDGETIATNHLGLIAAERGRDAEAKALFETSLSLSQQTGDQIYLALAQNNLANLALKRGELSTAEALYRTNLTLQGRLGNRWGEALAMNNLGVVALMAQDLPRAEGLLTKALATRQAVGDKVGQITCLRNLGILALMKGQAAEAAAFHDRALALAQASGQRTVEAECQFYVAELARLQQKLARARDGYQRVLGLLSEGVTPEVRWNALAGQAECLLRQPKPDLAGAGERLALVPAGIDSPYVHRARAWQALRLGRPAAALEALARALGDPRRQAPEIRAELEQIRTLFQTAPNP
ncbi:MAG: serine/threonine protein kinase [Holophagaceae bacterium]|uniref:Serine/threonine protein kinase n=1 Tax=Candidatus Geothrix skivensis TaxID=2954439 RepID=A0A9D7XH68_9BACT|nr:serine/threonine protein kinase [Candidatus Geothrix skivensis]